jgi:hypothetical protein
MRNTLPEKPVSPGDSSHLPVDPQDARELVKRIVASTSFRRSARLSDLILYVTRRLLDDGAVDMREQEIGTAVFERKPRYDTAQDPIARVHVSQLRKKLDQYFKEEGSHEKLLIEIPKGGYVPVFHLRPESPTVEPAASVVPAPAEVALPGPGRQNDPGPRNLVPVLTAACVLLAVCCVWLGLRAFRPRPGRGPAIQALWSSVLRSGQRTDLVAADSCFGLLQDSVHRSISLDEYLTHDPDRWMKGFQGDPASREVLRMMALRQYTSLADLELAHGIVAISDGFATQPVIAFARDFPIRAASTDNLVLLGSQRSNPWVELFLPRLNFRFETDEVSHRAIVRNRDPRPGEQDTYVVPGEGSNIREGYAVLALQPNLTGTGNVLMIYGSDMEATEAAGALATTEAELAPVLQRVFSRIPKSVRYCEILLKTRRLGGAPQSCTLLAWRQTEN